jgi:hypothetical protein
MATYTLKGPKTYNKSSVREWLLSRKLIHIKSHHHGVVMQGDALKSPLGFVAKVVLVNEQDRRIVISNAKLSKEELQNAF